MTKNELIRAAMHFPVGVAVACLISWSLAHGIMLGIAFLIYEIMNDWRKKDWSYKDVYGYIWGLAIGAIILLILRSNDIILIGG